jgi:hypothetical protein
MPPTAPITAIESGSLTRPPRLQSQPLAGAAYETAGNDSTGPTAGVALTDERVPDAAPAVALPRPGSTANMGTTMVHAKRWVSGVMASLVNNPNRDTADVDAEAPPDPEILGRWIAIAALMASAVDLQARGGGPWPALALVAADTANEAILGTIAASGANPPDRDALFDQVYSAAVAELGARGHPMPGSLKARVQNMHRQRNGAVHLNIEPTTRAIETAIRTTIELRDLVVVAVAHLEAFRASGPTRAVATIVGIESISGALTDAERLLGEGRLVEAADACAVALDGALERVRPGLRSYKHVGPLNPTERNLGYALQRADETANLHETWILALGLGLRPVELARLQRIVGQPDGTFKVPEPIERDPKVELTLPVVTWALRVTTDVIYRLHQGEGLSQREWPYDDPV